MRTFSFPLLLVCLLLSACGGKNGFGLTEPKAASDGNSKSGGGTPGSPGSPSSPAPTWDKVSLDGFQNGGSNDGRMVVSIDKLNQSFLMVLPIPLPIPLVAPLAIPNLPGATMSSQFDSSGGQSVAISIPLKLLVRQAVFSPNERLPSGDGLPFVPAGELPGFAIDFPQMQNYRIHLYVGVDIAAAFVELPDLGLPIGWTAPVKNLNKTKIIGAIGYVLPKPSFSGGMYLAAQLPGDLARAINDLIRW